jgi:hypothetical protein
LSDIYKKEMKGLILSLRARIFFEHVPYNSIIKQDANRERLMRVLLGLFEMKTLSGISDLRLSMYKSSIEVRDTCTF